MEEKLIEDSPGSEAIEGPGSLPFCNLSGQSLGLTLGFPSAQPLPPCTALPVAFHHKSKLLLTRKSLQTRWCAYVLLCYLLVDVHISQADAELPSTGDHSTVRGCALTLQLQDGAHVLQQGGESHMDHISLSATLGSFLHCAHLNGSPACCSPSSLPFPLR